jgi:hypothetical protein
MKRFIGPPIINITQKEFMEAMSNYMHMPEPFQPMKFPYNVPTKMRVIKGYSDIFVAIYYDLDWKVVWIDPKYCTAEVMFDENDPRTWA